MVARATLVLTDRAGTPVAHNYTPDGDDTNGIHVFTEKTGIPAGNPRFTAGIKKSPTKCKVSLKLAVPVVQTQTLNGISSPVIVRTAYVDVVATFDSLSSEQERKDAIGLMTSALAANQAVLNPLITQLEDIW